jgi:hypothetical protein
MVEQITVRYRDRLSGIVSCYDRIVITGTIPWACYAAGMTSFLHMHQIRIFDYARFAEPLRVTPALVARPDKAEYLSYCNSFSRHHALLVIQSRKAGYLLELPRDYTHILHWPDCSGMVAGFVRNTHANRQGGELRLF